MAGSDSDDSEDAKLPAALRTDPDATSYVYRDFADLPADPNADNGPAIKRGNSESSIRVQKFPVKLYAILAQQEFSDIVTWMPHGRAWKVLKPNLFESLVMPLFFEYSNYHSFNRLVNAWSFRRISSGPDRGAYYHELFLRGKPHLQRYMRRLPKTHKKLTMKKDDEPDFYKMSQTSPLPELEDDQVSNTVGGRLGQTLPQGDAISTASVASMPGTGMAMNPALTSARMPTTGMASYPGSLSASLLNRPGSLGSMDAAASARLAAFEAQASARLPPAEPSMNPLSARLSVLDQYTASLQPPPPSAASLSSPSAPPSASASRLSASLQQRDRAGLASLAGGFPSMPPPFEPSFQPPLDPANSAAAAQVYQLQRMRHLQHLHQFQREQLGHQGAAGSTGDPPLTEEELLRLRAFGQGGGRGGGSGRPPFM